MKLWLKSKIESLASGPNKSGGRLVNQFPRSRKETREIKFENASGRSRESWLLERSKSWRIRNNSYWNYIPFYIYHFKQVLLFVKQSGEQMEHRSCNQVYLLKMPLFKRQVMCNVYVYYIKFCQHVSREGNGKAHLLCWKEELEIGG
jgi:hypothetical protein